jgi:UDP-N-acetylglucosamine--N-acetylmuramyl-(pentapeptide) pyrophosphoryl-undecaprenol N-acetylglucosamine transferase
VRAASAAHSLANYRAVENLANLLEELVEKQGSTVGAEVTA